jgi:hypothetical protein
MLVLYYHFLSKMQSLLERRVIGAIAHCNIEKLVVRSLFSVGNWGAINYFIQA